MQVAGGTIIPTYVEESGWEMVETRAAKLAATAVEPAYDVAISFLVADEAIAAAVRDGLSGLNVFFYPHKQEELIGVRFVPLLPGKAREL